MSFKSYINESRTLTEMESNIIVMAYLLEENLDNMNETDYVMLAEGINDKLGKVGLKLHKGKGIIDYIKDFTMGVGRLFLALMKGDKNKAKEILKTVSKEDVLDFLYKLDLGTLHLITGPLHTIDAWTGWDLGVKVKQKMEKAKDIYQEIKHALQTVKQKIKTAFDKKVAPKLISKIGEIEKVVAPTNESFDETEDLLESTTNTFIGK